MKLPTIIGVAGTNGSGKDTLGDLLQAKSGYKAISLSDILREELTKQGLPHTRENLSGLSNSIRTAEGEGAMATRAIEKYGQNGVKLCITSLRTPGEADEIQKAGGVIVWIDADPKIRYERLQANNRGRGATDEITFDEFLRQQDAEMSPSVQGGGLNMAGVKNKADVYVTNEFTSLEEYAAYLIEQFELA